MGASPCSGKSDVYFSYVFIGIDINVIEIVDSIDIKSRLTLKSLNMRLNTSVDTSDCNWHSIQYFSWHMDIEIIYQQLFNKTSN